MSINENADLDPSQVEDLRGKSGGGIPGGNPSGIPGGGGGISGAAAGAGCLSALMPFFRKNPKLGCLAVVVAVICLGGFVCLNTTNVGQNVGVGGIGGIGGGGAVPNEPEGNADLQQACSTANPDRFQRTDCRNLLYINSIQAYWQQALPQYYGRPYQKATTRLFSGGVNTACGAAGSGMGPFYCPADNHVYIDLAFYDELARRYGAPGQFAQADIDQALRAAAAVGDDTIQKKTTGQINESGFTHGSAEQRQQWFNKGYQTGDPRQCNTFS